jgi:hypothetical protein
MSLLSTACSFGMWGAVATIACVNYGMNLHYSYLQSLPRPTSVYLSAFVAFVMLGLSGGCWRVYMFGGTWDASWCSLTCFLYFSTLIVGLVFLFERMWLYKRGDHAHEALRGMLVTLLLGFAAFSTGATTLANPRLALVTVFCKTVVSSDC